MSETTSRLVFREVGAESIDAIRELWEKLNVHHPESRAPSKWRGRLARVLRCYDRRSCRCSRGSVSRASSLSVCRATPPFQFSGSRHAKLAARKSGALAAVSNPWPRGSAAIPGLKLAVSSVTRKLPA